MEHSILLINVDNLMDGLVMGTLIVILFLSLIAIALIGSWAWDLKRKNKSLIHSLKNVQPTIDFAFNTSIMTLDELEKSLEENKQDKIVIQSLCKEIKSLNDKISRKNQPRDKHGLFVKNENLTSFNDGKDLIISEYVTKIR